MRIAIDIDSTLHHYWTVLERIARERYGVELPYERQTTWQIASLTREQARACIEATHADHEILAAKPYPGAAEVVRRWRETGHFIHVTSHRAESARSATQTWLANVGLPYDELYLSLDKVSRCREIGIDLIVDDSPPILTTALELGMVATTIIHPWNRALVGRDGVIGATSWSELAQKLGPLLGR